MRKFLVFPDGERYELSPLTEDEFKQLDQWSGGSDGAFREFLAINDFHEIDSFDDSLLSDCHWVGDWTKGEGGWEVRVKLKLEPGEPTINWDVHYGSMLKVNGRWCDYHPEAKPE